MISGWGITPIVAAPFDLAPFATAPIIEAFPPPQTRSQPCSPIASPIPNAKSRELFGISGADEQKTDTRI